MSTATTEHDQHCPRWCDGDHGNGRRVRHVGIVGTVVLRGDEPLTVALSQRPGAPEPRIDIMHDKDGHVHITSLQLPQAGELFAVLAAAFVDAGYSPTGLRPTTTVDDAPETADDEEERGGWSALLMSPVNAGGFPTPWTMVRHA